jgi:hypothetical protein
MSISMKLMGGHDHERQPLIDERERTLALKAQAAKRKLMAKALLIRRLKQPRAEMSMYFDARRDHLRGTILESSRLPVFMCHLSLSTPAPRSCVAPAAFLQALTARTG